MGDDHDRGTLPIELTQEGHDLIRRPGIEIAGGFISQDDGRVTHQGTGDRHPLTFAARELVRPVLEAMSQPNSFEHLDGLGSAAPTRDAVIQPSGGDIFDIADAIDQMELLEHETDLAAP